MCWNVVFTFGCRFCHFTLLNTVNTKLMPFGFVGRFALVESSSLVPQLILLTVQIECYIVPIMSRTKIPWKVIFPGQTLTLPAIVVDVRSLSRVGTAATMLLSLAQWIDNVLWYKLQLNCLFDQDQLWNGFAFIAWVSSRAHTPPTQAHAKKIWKSTWKSRIIVFSHVYISIFHTMSSLIDGNGCACTYLYSEQI